MVIFHQMADRVCKKVDDSDLIQKYGYDPLKQIGKEKVNGVSNELSNY